MKIEQIVNNQFRVRTDKGVYFQSYNSVVAFKGNDGKVVLGANYRYSRTTMKYLISFLNLDSIKEVDMAVSSGKFIVDEELTIR